MNFPFSKIFLICLEGSGDPCHSPSLGPFSKGKMIILACPPQAFFPLARANGLFLFAHPNKNYFLRSGGCLQFLHCSTHPLAAILLTHDWPIPTKSFI